MQQSFGASIVERNGVIRAYAAAVFAGIVIRYVASVAHPSFGHALFAFLAVASILAAYLLIAGARLEAHLTGAHIIAAAVLGGVCFAITSFLV
jgi:uncharacterized membrane protein YjjP (DUF1212 family)